MCCFIKINDYLWVLFNTLKINVMVTNEMTITRKEFIILTNSLDPSVSFSHLFMVTEPKMNKGGRKGLNQYYEKVSKFTKTRVLVGMEYEKRRQKTDPEFKVGTNRIFDTHLNSFLGFNSKYNRYYLKYEWFEGVPPKSEYKFNGDPIEKKLFEEWLIVSNNVLNYQVVNLNNLHEITLNHTKYILTGEC